MMNSLTLRSYWPQQPTPDVLWLLSGWTKGPGKTNPSPSFLFWYKTNKQTCPNILGCPLGKMGVLSHTNPHDPENHVSSTLNPGEGERAKYFPVTREKTPRTHRARVLAPASQLVNANAGTWTRSSGAPAPKARTSGLVSGGKVSQFL